MQRVRGARGPGSPLARVVLGVVVALSGCRSEEKPAGGPQGAGGGGKPLPVEVVELRPGPVRDTQDYLGTLISRTSVTVYPQVTGYVQRIAVRPGQRVEAGQLLIQVDPREAQAGLQGLQAQRASAQASLELARSNRVRSEQLYREGLLSRQDYEQAVAQAESAEASARAIQAQLSAQSVQLDYTRVQAPFAGVVGDVPVKVGDSVTPQTVLTSVDQSQALEVSVGLPPQRAAEVRVGHTRVEVLDAKGEPVVSAPVFFVAPTPDARTQLVEVKAAFENPARLMAGQRVPVRVVFDVREALRLPTYAVTRQSGQTFAWVVASSDGGAPVVQRKPVGLGDISDNAFEVLEGLRPGDRVAVSSLQLLQDGQPVEPKPARERSDEAVGGGGDAGVGDGADAGH